MFYADEEGAVAEDVKKVEEDTEMKDGGEGEEEEEEEEEVVEETKEGDVESVIEEFKRMMVDTTQVDTQLRDSGRVVKVVPSPLSVEYSL